MQLQGMHLLTKYCNKMINTGKTVIQTNGNGDHKKCNI